MWSERSEVDERVRAEASRDQGQACRSPRQQGFQVMRVYRVRIQKQLISVLNRFL